MLQLSKKGNEIEANKINDLLMPLHKRLVTTAYMNPISYYTSSIRLFLEANPIPAKKALQLMGKIGKDPNIVSEILV